MTELNEIKSGKEIGKSQRCKYIYLKCERCGNCRWVRYNYAKKHNFIVYCKENSCAMKTINQIKNKNNPLFWDGNGTPSLGMVTKASIVGYKGRMILTYNECPECHKKLWRQKCSIGKMCSPCKNSKLYSGLRGVLSGQWKGGRYLLKDSGYIMLTIQPDDPFYPMSDHGRILEHRYIYAKVVAHRLLEEWEIVHHINHIRDDNRIENFSLEDRVSHFPDNMLVKAFNKLREENRILKERYVNKQLDAILTDNEF